MKTDFLLRGSLYFVKRGSRLLETSPQHRTNDGDHGDNHDDDGDDGGNDVLVEVEEDSP